MCAWGITCESLCATPGFSVELYTGARDGSGAQRWCQHPVRWGSCWGSLLSTPLPIRWLVPHNLSCLLYVLPGATEERCEGIGEHGCQEGLRTHRQVGGVQVARKRGGHECLERRTLGSLFLCPPPRLSKQSSVPPTAGLPLQCRHSSYTGTALAL